MGLKKFHSDSINEKAGDNSYLTLSIKSLPNETGS